MGKELFMFGDIRIKKNKCYPYKTTKILRLLDIEKVLVSRYKISFGEKNHKYFLGYLHHDNKLKPLHIMLPKTKWMYFLIEDDGLLEKYNTIQDKDSAHIKKEFPNKPVYNKEYLKQK